MIRLRSFARDERATSAAEFALVLPVMLFFLLGIIDVGRFMWYVSQAEFTLLAIRSEEARTVFREHRAMFEDQMVAVFAEVLDKLGRIPAIALEQLSEAAIALFLHALMQDAMGLSGLGVDELTDVVLPELVLGLSREK